MGLQIAQLIVKGHPFGDAGGQFSAMLELLENLEIIPAQLRVSGVGIVLRGSDAPLRQILQGGFDSLSATVMVRFGDHRGHRVTRGFTQNAGGLAGGVAIDFAAFRILAGNRDAGQLQRPGVSDGDVSIHALQKDGMVGGDFIDVPAAGEFFHRPQSFVPASADNPFAGSGALHSVANAVAKFGQGFYAAQFHGQAPKARVGQVHVSIVESGHYKVPAQIDDRGRRSLQLDDFVVPADWATRPSRTAIASARGLAWNEDRSATPV